MTIAKDFLRATRIALLGVGSLLLVTACGGGGGGGSGSSSSVAPSTSIPPTDSVTEPDSPTNSDGITDSDSIDAGGTGEVTIAWTASAVNTDGSCSSGIQGYRVNVGLTPNYYDYSTTVEPSRMRCSTVSTDACGDVRRCTYTVQGLTSASWYLAVQTVDVYGNESGYSEQVVATVVN